MPPAPRAVLAVAGALLAASCATLPIPQAPYVPTPEPVAIAMLRLASVAPDDVVYDLGSGDGRIVVAAARDFGARGVGVEIDPRLVGESRDRAFTAGVADRAHFVADDLFRIDLRPATVVTLYLGNAMNQRVRGKLLAELRPGVRVVSHAFDMDDWPPDEVRDVHGIDQHHTLYLWIVPAHVEGGWHWSAADGRAHALRLRQRFQAVSATLAIDGVEAARGDGRVRGDRVTVTVGTGTANALAFDGRVHENRIEGTVTTSGGSTAWTARRDGAR